MPIHQRGTDEKLLYDKGSYAINTFDELLEYHTRGPTTKIEREGFRPRHVNPNLYKFIAYLYYDSLQPATLHFEGHLTLALMEALARRMGSEIDVVT